MDPDLQLGRRDEKIDGLQRAQDLHNHPNRSESQIVRSLQDLLQPLDQTPYVQERVAQPLLQFPHLVRDLVLLADSLALQLADLGELTPGEVAQVARAEAAEEVGKLGLEAEAGLGVDEVEGGGGPPSADPGEGPLERWGPRGGENGKDVVFGCERFGSVVVLVVGHDSVDQGGHVVLHGLVELVLVSGNGEELLEMDSVLLDPCLAEAMETHFQDLRLQIAVWLELEREERGRAFIDRERI